MSARAPHQIRVFTWKEGLLSRVAHDLRLRVERFTIAGPGDNAGGDLTVEVDAGSIVVDGVMNGSRCDPDQLGARDRAKIAETIRAEILKTRAYPKVVFRGSVSAGTGVGARVRVDGTLELVGVRRSLSLVAVREGERLRGSVTLVPSEFGIRPYKALAGAIRLRDRVRVDFDLDAVALAL
ncbi:YceI family protein [Enhygromyxa salina]|uniref:YceI-like domain protein n=1 Tax=Enhygromyxa salina TaxID=215803 RepID=A0A2S9YS04_9BACT|nr:YceI family protein [Enhygromyxa salina]PRQ07874.1 YceI-like domain protein [Enhygromyxa salina]